MADYSRENWWGADSPGPMLEGLGVARDGRGMHALSRLGERKMILWGCAVCRTLWPQLGPASRAAVAALETYADDLPGGEEPASLLVKAEDVSGEFHRRCSRQRTAPPGMGTKARRAFHAEWRAADAVGLLAGLPFVDWPHLAETAENARRAASGRRLNWIDWYDGPSPWAANLLRDVVGDPFDPPTFPQELPPAVLAREGGAVRRLAEYVYQSGDFSGLGPLADALKEAGLPDGPILWHLEGRAPVFDPGNCGWRLTHRPEVPHARGCWVIDLLAGRGEG